MRNKSLRTLIAFAYKMSGDQQNFLKLNVPDFVLTERFDIEARTTNRQATKDDYRAMVRSLLADRFALKVHNETRESKLYALVLNTPGKLGPNIRIHPADDATCATTTTDTAGLRLKFKTYNGEGYPPLCGSVVNTQWQRQGTDTKYVMGIAGRNIPMATLAAAIVNAGDTGLEHAVVVDKTGITSNVDFTLNLGYDEMESTFTPNTGPYLLQNLRDQLGMKLRTGKGRHQRLRRPTTSSTCTRTKSSLRKVKRAAIRPPSFFSLTRKPLRLQHSHSLRQRQVVRHQPAHPSAPSPAPLPATSSSGSVHPCAH